jgi:hypothetical protein
MQKQKVITFDTSNSITSLLGMFGHGRIADFLVALH